MTAVTNGEIHFSAAQTGTVSVFCLSEPAKGISLEGLQYPLTDAELTPDFPLGVSNSFLGRPARVSVQDGTLLLLWYPAKFSPPDLFSERNGGAAHADPRCDL